jgi:GTP-binding protein
LNALAGRRIAKVSATPGKTRMMNVYQFSLVRGARSAVASLERQPSDAHREQPRTAHSAFFLLDLPGYGFARASQADRRAFRGLITHTLARPGLTGVVWLLDIRHAPSTDDRTMHELFAGRGTRVLAALTKSDKLPRRQRESREHELRAALALDDDQMIVTSAREQEGIGELREALGELVRVRGSPG